MGRGRGQSRPRPPPTCTVRGWDRWNSAFRRCILYWRVEALKDDALFRRAYVEHGAVTWPGELDLAPDAMYGEIKRHGEWVLR